MTIGLEPHIDTFTGRSVSLTDGAPGLDDIFLAYCRTPMYAGQTDAFYSIGHHCLATAYFGWRHSQRIAMLCLLHEAEVAVFGDIPGPVKVPGQRDAEWAVRERVFSALGIEPPTPAEWDIVEEFDKLEQAAVSRWNGLAVPLHQALWKLCDFRHDITEKTQQLLDLYPPGEGLVADSPLYRRLFQEYYRLRAAAK